MKRNKLSYNMPAVSFCTKAKRIIALLTGEALSDIFNHPYVKDLVDSIPDPAHKRPAQPMNDMLILIRFANICSEASTTIPVGHSAGVSFRIIKFSPLSLVANRVLVLSITVNIKN